MSLTNVEKWWCCLNQPERGSFVLCAAQAVVPPYFIIKTVFDAYWLAQSGPSITIRKEIFVTNWGMAEATIDIPGIGEVTVYLLDFFIWNDINAYIYEEGIDCAAPCKVLVFSG